MQAAGVPPGDSRDEKGRPRFFPFVPNDLLDPKAKHMDYWYWKNIAHDHDQVGIGGLPYRGNKTICLQNKYINK